MGGTQGVARAWWHRRNGEGIEGGVCMAGSEAAKGCGVEIGVARRGGGLELKLIWVWTHRARCGRMRCAVTS